MKILVLLFLLAALASSSARVDYRVHQLLARLDLGPRKCTQPGLMCRDCEQPVMCVSDGKGNFTEHLQQKCKSPKTCLKGRCGTANNPFCNGLATASFVCNSVGVFPDPVDCKKYHFCVPSEDNKPPHKNHDAHCDGDYRYNSKTTYCDVPLPGGECPMELDRLPVPICDDKNENTLVDKLEENESIYYVCSEYPSTELLYPFLYLCPNGKVFDKTGYQCKDASQPPPPPPPTQPPPTSFY